MSHVGYIANLLLLYTLKITAQCKSANLFECTVFARMDAVATIIFRSEQCGVYSRAAAILLRSLLSAASIWGRPLNEVWRLFKLIWYVYKCAIVGLGKGTGNTRERKKFCHIIVHNDMRAYCRIVTAGAVAVLLYRSHAHSDCLCTCNTIYIRMYGIS